MKLLNLLVFTLFITAFFGPLNGQSYQLTKSDFSVSGTSNLHDWESAVTKISWRGNFLFEEGVLKEVSGVKVNIPVDGIISTKGRIMDNKTHDALEAEQHPNIIFTLGSAAVTNTGTTTTVAAKGQLTVAGTSRTISLQVKVTPLADGRLEVSGAYPMKMTDYGIDPPTAVLGTLTTGDEVTINFTLTLSPK